MIGSAQTAEAVAGRLQGMGIPIVFDPVMVATSGGVLADEATVSAFGKLMDLAALTTPNVPELEALGGMAALQARGIIFLAKGGDAEGPQAVDRLIGPEGEIQSWTAPRIETRHTHGTGCTLASAIAVELARGRSLHEAVEAARSFVRSALLAAPGFGGGHGPMGHWAAAGGAMNLNQVTLPARDYAEAVTFYRALGLTQIVDAPGKGYARFECPGGATLSIHVDAEPQVGGALVYLESTDLDRWVEELGDAGIILDQSPRDESWGWREARLRDPTGNRLCLYRAGEYRRFPPWRISTV
jgi:hydroxymethylpyrimidine/phosphomethylpyrimidine kinase